MTAVEQLDETPADSRHPLVELEHRALGSAIREARVRRGMMQIELATEAGCNRSSVRRIELALTTPTYHRVVRIARALGLTPGELCALADREAAVLRAREEDR